MRTVFLLMVGVAAGVAARSAVPVGRAAAPQTPAAQSGGRGGAGTVDIAPTPVPPLYPDATPVSKPMHYSWSELQRIHEVRRRNAAQGVPDVAAPGDPKIAAQMFRTHQFGVSSSGYGITYRRKYDVPRPSQAIGVVSQYEDADQHEGVTDFLIMVGGAGRFVVDGEIANREYGRDPRAVGPNIPPRNTGDVRPLLLGEFHGQPVRNGHVYAAKAGDWLIVPPGVPHWWLPEPAEGMSYLILKVNIGLYPPALID